MSTYVPPTNPAAVRPTTDRGSELPPPKQIASLFEFWPPWLFYLPVGVWYALLALRYRSLTLPTIANPTIHTGGLAAESKGDILAMVQGPASHSIPRWVRFLPGEDALAAMHRGGLHFPIVAKPDIGQRGAGVRLIRRKAELTEYLAAYEAKVPIILQELADLPGEAGIFWIRHPEAPSGFIYSLTLKEFPQLTGDGRSTIAELIRANPRTALQARLFRRRLGGALANIPALGERVPLVFCGNHCQGAIFRDGSAHITEELTDWMNQFAGSIPEFWFGRLDVRFPDLDSLRRGVGLRVIEINGASAEATNIWDPDFGLLAAWRTLAGQFSHLFRIAESNRRRGFQPMRLRDLIREIRRSLQLCRQYP
jgi:hypothetical protein